MKPVEASESSGSQRNLRLEINCFPRTETETYDDASDEWIQCFLRKKGNEILCKVSSGFIKDPFNLKGLERAVPSFTTALYNILDIKLPESSGDEKMEDSPLELTQSSIMIYCLIHQRFVQTREGLKQAMEKYEKGAFGYCPRVLCERRRLLPTGSSADFGVAKLQMYCPSCQEIYAPSKERYSNIDSAFYGPNFPHAFVLNYPSLFGKCRTKLYEPEMFGFKLHKIAPSRPQKLVYDYKTQKVEACPKPVVNFAAGEGKRVIREFLVKKIVD